MAKILIVDDENEILDFLRIRLEKSGFEVLTTDSGMEGLNLARSEAPDLIILDMMMPQIDGLKVCKMLKFDQKYAHIPIILLTARDLSDDLDILKDIRVDEYISKPFDAKHLVATMRKLLTASGAGDVPAPTEEEEE